MQAQVIHVALEQKLEEDFPGFTIALFLFHKTKEKTALSIWSSYKVWVLLTLLEDI